jgi:hypothetical protein
MALAEIDGCESNCDDSDAELSGGNNDNSYLKAPSDSTYCEGDEWSIKKSSLRMTWTALPFF